MHSAIQTIPISTGGSWGRAGLELDHCMRLLPMTFTGHWKGTARGSPPSSVCTKASLKLMRRGMLFSTEPVVSCPIPSGCALLTGFRQGLGLAQGHTAGGGCEGLRPPDSALAAPQPPAAQTGQSAASMLAEVNRNDLFADEQKPKKLPWSDSGGQLATAAERVPTHPRNSSLVTTGGDYRAGKWAGAGLVFLSPSSRVWRDLSDPPGYHFKAVFVVVLTGVGPLRPR